MATLRIILIVADIDNLNLIYALDKDNYLGSICALPKQISQAWQEISQIKIPNDFGQILNIVVSGMGGSALGPEMVGDLYSNEISYPYQIIRDYKLPYYIGKKTLVILNSYSGNTEETLSCANFALGKGAKVFAISTGGKLIEFFKQKNLPFYQFEPIHNPCNQPRAGIGYSAFSILGLINKIKAVNIFEEEINKTVNYLEDVSKNFAPSVQSSGNPAKKLALEIKNKIPIIIGAEFLAGNCHVFANQLNETAKSFASYFVIPELNHHLLEVFNYPAYLVQHILFLFLNSSLFDDKIKRRIQLTKELLNQKNIEVLEYQVEAKTALPAVFEVLMFSSYASFYTAILNDTNPTSIPIVEEFKKKLKNEI